MSSAFEHQRYFRQLKPDTIYHQITFGGCGFLLPYHFGAVLCMFDNNIGAENAVGISGGAMAALAMLKGSDIYIGLRQGIIDLTNEGAGFILLGLNMLFMNYYFKYMWNYRCLRIPYERACELTKSSAFHIHDMTTDRLTSKQLTGRYHCLMVSIAVPNHPLPAHLGNSLDPLAKTVSGSFIDDSFLKLSKVQGAIGRGLKSMLVPVVIKEYQNDADIVQAAVLSGGIPGLTTFWPRYFDNHWCCMDRMTAHQIHISSSSDKLNELINTRRSNENLVKLAASASSGEYDDETAVEDRPAYDIDVSELEEQLAAASLIQMNTIAISPILYETDVFNGSDIGICGGFLNPFPIFPWDLNARKQAFVTGYLDMQKRIDGPKLIDESTSVAVDQRVFMECDDCKEQHHHHKSVEFRTIHKKIDSEETIMKLIDFILYDSYAKYWKRDDFVLNVDGVCVSAKDATVNVALKPHEQHIAIGVVILLLVLFWLSPVNFLRILVCILVLGASWIMSYVKGVSRINKGIGKQNANDFNLVVGELKVGSPDRKLASTTIEDNNMPSSTNTLNGGDSVTCSNCDDDENDYFQPKDLEVATPSSADSVTVSPHKYNLRKRKA